MNRRSRLKLHDDEFDIDAGLVQQLLAAQFPWLSGLPVRSVQSTGTVNAIYRLGDELYVRLPRVQRYADDLNNERQWLPRLAPYLSLRVSGGRLTAVIDFGSAGVRDPAADVVPAWSVFGSAGRAAYRTALAVDDATWNRARGLALHQAALIIPYYRETNPGFVTMARRTVEQVIADVSTGAAADAAGAEAPARH